jgi:GDP-D-mannose 3',5'-epimerase
MKKALVCGAGGFIGHHLVNRLKDEGYYVISADIKHPEFEKTRADEFYIRDLSMQNDIDVYSDEHYDEIYQLAADMGGAQFVFTKEHDIEIMCNSALINLNLANHLRKTKNTHTKVFFASSACRYNENNQLDPENPTCYEDSAWPANPDSNYGLEKLFAERVYLALNSNIGTPVRIGIFHNIFGPMGTWTGGREKAPAAICRKVAEAANGGTIDIFGDGKQTRSFLYVDECLEGIRRLMESDLVAPVNIGSEEMISINDLAYMAMDIAGKKLNINHINGPLGVRGRNSDNTLLRARLGWEPTQPLRVGMEKTYKWIEQQVKNAKN